MATYRAVQLTGKGGPEVLRETELPLVEPGPGEVRLAVRGTGAGGTDTIMRRGFYPYAPRIPFVPGYEVVGDVEAVGPGVTNLRVGQRVAGLVVHGGYAEKLVRSASEFTPVPDGLDDATAVAVILNYATAWQAIHRIAKVKAGDTVLVTGANGGIGTAMLELLGLVGARVLGAAGGRHFDLIRSYGATPIESRATRIDVGVRQLIPEGVDVTLDNLGNQFVMQCIRATRRGGTVVGIGFAATGGRVFGFLRSLATLYVIGSLTGRKATFFGITQVHRRDPSWLREDLPELLRLAADGAIKPRIAARLPLLAARKAAEMIERGSGEGKIVHLAAIQPADATHVASQPDSPNSRA
jgi:NADPH:quinone reductase-like Zn-dependent oxidoreductase